MLMKNVALMLALLCFIGYMAYPQSVGSQYMADLPDELKPMPTDYGTVVLLKKIVVGVGYVLSMLWNVVPVGATCPR